MSLKKKLHWIEYKEIGKWSILLFISGILLIIFIIGGCTEDKVDAILYKSDIIFIIEEPTTVYKTTGSNSVIVILNKGEKVQTLYFHPDGGYYRVKLQDGREGYILPNSHNVRVQQNLK